MFYVLTLPPTCGLPGNERCFSQNGVYAQALKTSNEITRLDMLKRKLGCSKCRLYHLPVGILETENTNMHKP
jgi:hypothetical protein